MILRLRIFDVSIVDGTKVISENQLFQKPFTDGVASRKSAHQKNQLVKKPFTDGAAFRKSAHHTISC